MALSLMAPSGNSGWQRSWQSDAPALRARERCQQEDDVSGLYIYQWNKEIAVFLTQIGTSVVGSAPDGPWGPEYGTVKGTYVEIFGLKGSFRNGSIEWSNGCVWDRRAEDIPAPAEAQDTVRSGNWGDQPTEADTSAPAGPSWGGKTDDASNWNQENGEGVEKDEDKAAHEEVQKKKRWQESQACQDYYLQRWILPGMSRNVQFGRTQNRASIVLQYTPGTGVY